ncbi:MAG: glycosyltransferase family 39 protein [Gemmatimonadales bacterium]|nr:glycosyltransferase family 39 protein [Gemmatimonadales bacterium]
MATPIPIPTANAVDRRLWILAVIVVALHVIVNVITPYGIHRDEFLYAAMGRHLSLFRMDFPPLIAIIAEAERAVFGDTIWGLRMVPAVAHGALVLLTARIAAELGGQHRAQWLAALTVTLTPLMMRAGSLFQPVILDQVAWTVGFLALVMIARDNRPRWWIVLGLAGGFGLLAKFSIAFFAVGAAVGIIFSPRRAALLTPWPWVAALIGLVIGAPSIVGQVVLGWPVTIQMQDLQASQLAVVTPGAFLTEQLLYGPIAWLGVLGLGALVLTRALRWARLVAISAVAITALLIILHGKAYYLGPIWPALAAAGAVWLCSVTHTRFRAIVPAFALIAILFGILIAIPMGLPILPKEQMAAYAARLGLSSAVTTNRGEVAELPQDFADMLGWEEFVRGVAEVWNELPESERATAVLAAGNYGRAGAIDWYGPRYGLPPAICGCGSYWFWGPGDRRGDVMVIAGGTQDELRTFMTSVTLGRTMTDRWRVGEEQSVPIWIGRGPKVPLATLWESLRGRN